MASRGTLLAVASNPPLGTSGLRTTRRIEQAQAALGFGESVVVNLFSLATYRSGEIAEAGATEAGWLAARPPVEDELGRADGVLLAYGTSAPAGAARLHFRGQVDWLFQQVAKAQVPAWWVGGSARHPSRWHRHSFRHYPGLDFAAALPRILEAVPAQVLDRDLFS